MNAYAGFDRSDYPGRAVMDWLKANTNLSFCGFYLPSPSHRDDSWMRADDADFDGWGFAPIYVGQETVGPGSHLVTAAQGALDGAEACARMAEAGFDKGAFVYLDLENGPPLLTPQREYVAAWVDAVIAGGYAPGVYCSFLFAAQIAALRPSARIWVFHVDTVSPHGVGGPNVPAPDPALSGFAGASLRQYTDEARIACPVASGGALAVDLDSSAFADPSAPVEAAAAA